MDDPWVVLGEVVKTQGLRGQVKVRSEIVDPENFLLPGICLRRRDGSLEPLEVLSYRRHKGGYVLAFRGCETIAAVSPLVGCELVCRGSQLPPPGEDEYYHYQILNLPVFTFCGRELGRLREIIPTAGHEVFVIRPENDQKSGDRELLLPMVASYVLEIDLEKGRITVDPEGRSGQRLPGEAESRPE
jgi:16S rRNA processing protein RimM